MARAAVRALQGLTGKDFGPPTDPTDEERAQAIRAWKKWWGEQR